MKLAVDDEHRRFFEANKGIEFEGVFTHDEIDIIRNEISLALSRRLLVSKNSVFEKNPQKIFESGRDLWRDSTGLKKITCQRRLGELVYQLVGERPIRIGYEQYYPHLDHLASRLAGKYTNFLLKPASLKEVSSMQGIACGILIGLTENEGVEQSIENSIFPRKKGNIVFLHPDGIIDWPCLLEGNGKEYYLIVYTIRKGIYIKNRMDPLTGSFIQLGYSSGDLLKDKLNPIIFR